LPKIAKYHHFYFDSFELGMIGVKEFADSPLIKINLLKTNGKEAREVIEEIRSLVFPILIPKPLSLERQEYLHQKIRPLVREEFRKVVCPKPNIYNLDISN
jgi:hypothetical protein